ncbi:hypothetical protein BDK51DRAFT_26421 [Blyttiomyces helicus]|uniref:Uncharacterized protein n=1 Tax=Blyttiomyces helicus TaxID=388810 RepID=A0A4P9WLG0_9FUNG|nr:hypothetical protein BDK51DRAFT_26421 [Blyttiomyces helicus]|eukprot:RKO92913.1 hypothetical protein BDK51DRAFT_26421 [Blyttiomyces helicus]
MLIHPLKALAYYCPLASPAYLFPMDMRHLQHGRRHEKFDVNYGFPLPSRASILGASTPQRCRCLPEGSFPRDPPAGIGSGAKRLVCIREDGMSGCGRLGDHAQGSISHPPRANEFSGFFFWKEPVPTGRITVAKSRHRSLNNTDFKSDVTVSNMGKTPMDSEIRSPILELGMCGMGKMSKSVRQKAGNAFSQWAYEDCKPTEQQQEQERQRMPFIALFSRPYLELGSKSESHEFQNQISTPDAIDKPTSHLCNADTKTHARRHTHVPNNISVRSKRVRIMAENHLWPPVSVWMPLAHGQASPAQPTMTAVVSNGKARMANRKMMATGGHVDLPILDSTGTIPAGVGEAGRLEEVNEQQMQPDVCSEGVWQHILSATSVLFRQAPSTAATLASLSQPHIHSGLGRPQASVGRRHSYDLSLGVLVATHVARRKRRRSGLTQQRDPLK